MRSVCSFGSRICPGLGSRSITCEEEVGARGQQIVVVEIFVAGHPLLVCLHEAGRLVLDTVAFQRAVNVVDNVL
ncbi:hypothetical protein PENTCL1PPCAC_416, partial [Pristionchus entomophagus]